MYRSPLRHNLDRHQLEVLNNDPATAEWKVLARKKSSSYTGSYKVESIKALRHAHGFGLKEAKDTMEAYADEYNHSHVDNDGSHVITVPLGRDATLEIRRRADGSNDIQVVSAQQYGLSDYDVLTAIVRLATEFADKE